MWWRVRVRRVRVRRVRVRHFLLLQLSYNETLSKLVVANYITKIPITIKNSGAADPESPNTEGKRERGREREEGEGE